MSWFLLVAAIIIPSGHIYDVTKDQASLIYCIMKGKTVDIGEPVEASILPAAREKTTLGLHHSSLINDLFQYVGVT